MAFKAEGTFEGGQVICRQNSHPPLLGLSPPYYDRFCIGKDAAARDRFDDFCRSTLSHASPLDFLAIYQVSPDKLRVLQVGSSIGLVVRETGENLLTHTASSSFEIDLDGKTEKTLSLSTNPLGDRDEDSTILTLKTNAGSFALLAKCIDSEELPDDLIHKFSQGMSGASGGCILFKSADLLPEDKAYLFSQAAYYSEWESRFYHRRDAVLRKFIELILKEIPRDSQDLFTTTLNQAGELRKNENPSFSILPFHILFPLLKEDISSTLEGMGLPSSIACPSTIETLEECSVWLKSKERPTDAKRDFPTSHNPGSPPLSPLQRGLFSGPFSKTKGAATPVFPSIVSPGNVKV